MEISSADDGLLLLLQVMVVVVKMPMGRISVVAKKERWQGASVDG